MDTQRVTYDFILGSSGDDQFLGLSLGAKVVFGAEGDDRIFGSQQGSKLYGGEGDDFIWGGRGDDLLHGGTGDDYLDGGDGADIFQITMASRESAKEVDTIVDFNPAEGDVLYLESWQDYNLTYALAQHDDNLHITIQSDHKGYQATNEIILIGVQASDLNQDSYSFEL